MTAHGGFKWPVSGPVEAPDWKPVAECGQGLHGWLWGHGDHSTSPARKEPDAKWLVVEVAEKGLVDLNGKVKFPRGNVIFCGFWWDAFALARKHRPKAKKLEASATGRYGHASATGDLAIACALGDESTVTAGEKGALIATYWDDKAKRRRVVVAYIGEAGIKAGQAYVLKGKKFVKAPTK